MSIYYYTIGSKLCSGGFSDIPDDDIDFITPEQAANYLAKVGCIGRNHHQAIRPYHKLALDALRDWITKNPTVVPLVYRGARATKHPLRDHNILFGSTAREVAEYYGEVVEYHNIIGYPFTPIVKMENYDIIPGEEVIFFPEHNPEIVTL